MSRLARPWYISTNSLEFGAKSCVFALLYLSVVILVHSGLLATCCFASPVGLMNQELQYGYHDICPPIVMGAPYHYFPFKLPHTLDMFFAFWDISGKHTLMPFSFIFNASCLSGSKSSLISFLLLSFFCVWFSWASP